MHLWHYNVSEHQKGRAAHGLPGDQLQGKGNGGLEAHLLAQRLYTRAVQVLKERLRVLYKTSEIMHLMALIVL